MDLPRKSFRVSRGHTYSYVHIEPSSRSPTRSILFLHGFPSLAIDWHFQIKHFASSGYGIIAPDLLGYGETSRPEEIQEYRLKLMAQDIVELLDHHGIVTPVIGVGHDWGVTLLSKVEFYYPQRFERLAFLTIGSGGPGQPFDLDAVNTVTEQRLGYAAFGYIKFLVTDPEALTLIDAHRNSFESLIFAKDPNLWRQYFGPIGGMKKWLEYDGATETLDEVRDEVVMKAHQTAFAVEKGGYTAPIKWYRGLVENQDLRDDQDELLAQGISSYRLLKPSLLILAGRDPISVPAAQLQMTQVYAPTIKATTLDVGHWIMLEQADQVNRCLEEFFEESHA